MFKMLGLFILLGRPVFLKRTRRVRRGGGGGPLR